MAADVRPEIENEGPSWAIVDGKKRMPVYNTLFGLEAAMKKASETGVSYVGIKNSGHMGACGVYYRGSGGKRLYCARDERIFQLHAYPGRKGPKYR